MDRREFLRRAALSVVALVVAPQMALEEVPPPIYGDGIHDDAPGIQYLLDRGEDVVLKPGTYRIGQTLRYP